MSSDRRRSASGSASNNREHKTVTWDGDVADALAARMAREEFPPTQPSEHQAVGTETTTND